MNKQLLGHPIYIATKKYQKRKHPKKRINKKWRKRYGYFEYNMMPHGQVVMMDNGVIWMTEKTYRELCLDKRSRQNETDN